MKVVRVRKDAAGATWQPPGGSLLSRAASNRPAPVQACHSSASAHTRQSGSHPRSTWTHTLQSAMMAAISQSLQARAPGAERFTIMHLSLLSGEAHHC